MLYRLHDGLKSRSLKIDLSKIKVVVFDKKNGVKNYKLYINGENVEEADEFVYLSRTMTEGGEMERFLIHANIGRCVVSNMFLKRSENGHG